MTKLGLIMVLVMVIVFIKVMDNACAKDMRETIG